MRTIRFATRMTRRCAAYPIMIAAAVTIVMSPARGGAQTATPPYSVAVFATTPAGLSAPDSVTFSAKNIFVGYGNGGAPDGSGDAISNIVEYDFKGNQLQNFEVTGHNDGLRYNPKTNELWAVQNEDGNSNVAIINLQNGKQKVYQLGTGPHGGGYDDIDFLDNDIYLSASAPTINPNIAPAIVRLKLGGKTPELTGILDGDATVTDVTTGNPVKLNLQDSDSMVVDPQGELVMTSQGDGELIIVQHPGLPCQNAFRVPLSSQLGGPTMGNTQLDDTVFTNRSAGKLLVADKGLNAIYSITVPYFAATAYSAVSVFSSPTAPNPIASFVGQTDLTTGFVSPIVTGMMDPGGMAFIPSNVDLEKYVKPPVKLPAACP
jgi:hypothetical protein